MYSKSELDKLMKAGQIAAKAREYGKTLVKEGASVLEIADKIEAKMIELGGQPAFPTDVSINEMAAHHCPAFGEKTILKKGDLVKLDLGAHVDGFMSDTAVTISVGNVKEDLPLIVAVEDALAAAIKLCTPGREVWEIGKAIQDVITKAGFAPIRNLSGHSIQQHDLHSDITIPNTNNRNKTKLEDGMVIAIEPFATPGDGLVNDVREFQVFRVKNVKNMRTNRDVLEFVLDTYETMPFCARWLIKKFGVLKTNLALKEMVAKGILHEYTGLKEISEKKASQAEHTIIVGQTPIVTTA